MPAQLAITMQDAKGKSATHFINLPGATSLLNATLFANAWAVGVDAITGGKITNLGLCYRIALPGGLKATAEATSDVEEGARLTFRGANNFPVQMRIPTFLESKLLAGTKQVDLTDGDVDACVDLMIDGEGVGGAAPCDVREDDLESIETARELFVKDRGA